MYQFTTLMRRSRIYIMCQIGSVRLTLDVEVPHNGITASIRLEKEYATLYDAGMDRPAEDIKAMLTLGAAEMLKEYNTMRGRHVRS